MVISHCTFVASASVILLQGAGRRPWREADTLRIAMFQAQQAF